MSFRRHPNLAFRNSALISDKAKKFESSASLGRLNSEHPLITVDFDSDFCYLVGRPNGRMIEENMDLSELENLIMNGKNISNFLLLYTVSKVFIL